MSERFAAEVAVLQVGVLVSQQYNIKKWQYCISMMCLPYILSSPYDFTHVQVTIERNKELFSSIVITVGHLRIFTVFYNTCPISRLEMTSK